MKQFYYFFIVLLFFTATQCSESTVAPEQVTIDSPVTQRILENTNLISEVYDDTVFQVSPGVEETDIHYTDNQGYTVHVFILKVDLNNPEVSLEAAMSYNGTTFETQTVPAMAEEADSTGHRVVAAINADFFNSDAPWGIVVDDSEILKETWSQKASQSFFALLPNGDPLIGNREVFSTMQDSLYEALGGTHMLVDSSEVIPTSDPSVEPRTGVGLSDDGVVYFIVADGRDLGYSNGMTLYQLAKMLKACGANKAINLDGGGSSTFVIRQSEGGEVWDVRNKPSDGAPRAVSNAWLVVQKSE